MNNEYRLTTVDNPYDPFEQFDEWLQYDTENGYYSSDRLMRIAQIGDDFTEREINEEIERAIDEIIKYDFLDVYKKATRLIAS